jgi:uncharacterized protein
MTTALITGASSGIGETFARQLAARGHHLVLVARDEARLEERARQIETRHEVTVEILPADLLDSADRKRVERRLADTARPVDVLVNNAGFGLAAPFPHSPIEDEERMLDIHTRVPMRLTYAAIPGMKARGSGAVINVASVAGLLPTGTYGAAKAALIALSESLRVDLGPLGIQVLAMCPGFTRTEFQARAQMDVSKIPGWAWLDPDDVVQQALKDLHRSKPISITGRRYRAYAFAARHLPRKVVAARMARSRTTD